MRFLGLDLGEKRIGVAVSDPSGSMALPSQVIQRTDRMAVITRILDLVLRNQIERIVVGLPLTLEGETGPQAKRVLAFCKSLQRVSPVPVVTWDERLSTVDAEARLVEVGVSRKKRREKVDASAAAVILQSYLDSQRRPAT